MAEFVAAECWITDGNYSSKVQDLIWARADTVVWLDLPRHRVMRRIIWRTLRRVIAGTELWNGNRESWVNLLRADPEESILRWAWTQHGVTRARYRAAQADPAHARLRFVRLATPAQVAEFTRRAGACPGPG